MRGLLLPSGHSFPREGNQSQKPTWTWMKFQSISSNWQGFPECLCTGNCVRLLLNMLTEYSQLEQTRYQRTKHKDKAAHQLKRKLNNKYIATWKFDKIYKNVYIIVMVKRKYCYMYTDSCVSIAISMIIIQAKVCSN